MRRLGIVLISLVLLALVGAGLLWQFSRTDLFWRWGGRKLVNSAQERLRGELTVKEIRGNPLTGLSFEGITLREPQGEVFQAEKLELRFSLWSLVKLQPVVAYVGLYHPRLNLSRDQQGRWNVGWLLQPGPAAAPPFTSLDFSRIAVKRGEIALTLPGESRTFSEIDFQGALSLRQPGRPRQTVSVPGADLSFSLPQGRYRLNASLTHTREALDIPSIIVYSEVRPLGALAGKIKLDGAEPLLHLSLELEPAAGGELHRVWPGVWPGSST